MTSQKKSPPKICHHGVSRRVFLAAGLLTTAVCFLPYEAVAAVSRVFSTERELSFYNIHTGENMKAKTDKHGKPAAHAVHLRLRSPGYFSAISIMGRNVHRKGRAISDPALPFVVKLVLAFLFRI